MRLQNRGVTGSGVALLDSGLTDLQSIVIGGVVHLYSSNGRNGGIVAYTLAPDGTMSVQTTVIFPPGITSLVVGDLVLTQGANGPMLMVGSNAQGLFGYALGANGGVGGAVQMTWSQAQSAAGAGDVSAIQALIALSNQAPQVFPGGFATTQVCDLADVTVGGQAFVLVACAARNGVTAFRVDATNGALTEVDALGAEQGLGINLPTAMEVVEIGGRTFVLLAAAGTSSISVMELRAGGRLEPTDHVLDTGSTRFEGVQALSVAQDGDHVFVVAGGADHGLTLFLLLPDGRLVHLQTLADTNATSLHNVTTISTVISGDTLHVFAGSQNDAGISRFAIDLSSLGVLLTGTQAPDSLVGGARDDILMASGLSDTLAGGAGMDVLVTGSGATRMTGGADADLFVIRNGSGTTTITDFQRGLDRLDLSDLPMLRDVSQLTFLATANGVRIEYRGHVLLITAADGRVLTRNDLFPGGFDGGDHFPVFPREEPPPPPPDPGNRGVYLPGTPWRDTLTGTDRDDTIIGGTGKDTIEGGLGNDLIDGGPNPDVIRARGGNNTIHGGMGRDVIFAGDGDDLIYGDEHRDRIYGGGGNDTIYGGLHNDTLWGNDGDDLIYAVDGDNFLNGGAGNDTLVGADGNDRLYGARGNDLIIGGAGNDTLDGWLGNDTLICGDGNDIAYGQEGNDSIEGGAGNDTLLGRDGDDTLNGGSGNDQINGGRGNDLINTGDGWNTAWGGDGNDTIIGGADADWISGGAGDDVMYGGSGNDTFRGGAGYDVYWGGAGADVFEFFGDHDTGRIMDFSPSQGDAVRLAASIWWSMGNLTTQQVVEHFGSFDANGNVVLDFTDVGGNVVILDGYQDLASLSDYLQIM